MKEKLKKLIQSLLTINFFFYIFKTCLKLAATWLVTNGSWLASIILARATSTWGGRIVSKSKGMVAG